VITDCACSILTVTITSKIELIELMTDTSSTNRGSQFDVLQEFIIFSRIIMEGNTKLNLAGSQKWGHLKISA
jgi:hypothetical protein